MQVGAARVEKQLAEGAVPAAAKANAIEARTVHGFQRHLHMPLADQAGITHTMRRYGKDQPGMSRAIRPRRFQTVDKLDRRAACSDSTSIFSVSLATRADTVF